MTIAKIIERDTAAWDNAIEVDDAVVLAADLIPKYVGALDRAVKALERLARTMDYPKRELADIHRILTEGEGNEREPT